MRSKLTLIAIFPFFFAGCAGQDIGEGIYGGIYDGVRAREMSQNTPIERAARPDMAYDQYSAERKKLLEKDSYKCQEGNHQPCLH